MNGTAVSTLTTCSLALRSLLPGPYSTVSHHGRLTGLAMRSSTELRSASSLKDSRLRWQFCKSTTLLHRSMKLTLGYMLLWILCNRVLPGRGLAGVAFGATDIAKLRMCTASIWLSFCAAIVMLPICGS